MTRIQCTIRGISERLDARLREGAAREGHSLNDTILEALAAGVGMSGNPVRYSDLDDLAGTWVHDLEFDRAVEEMKRVDPELVKGKVLPMNTREEAWRWMDFSREDLKIAELALNAGIFNQTSFHAQQCVEKSLKACLAASGELLPRTHLIADLIGQLPASSQERFSDILADLMLLDQHSIPTRYPDALPGSLPEGLPDREQSARELESARTCLQRAESFLES